MRWSAVPFGKYKGKTFPEIIVRDPDWFFWILAESSTARSQKRPKSWRVEHAPSKFQRGRRNWRSNMSLTWIVGLMALSLSTPTALIRDGLLDFHTSICGGLFAANMTSERAVSCFGISGDIILASTND